MKMKKLGILILLLTTIIISCSNENKNVIELFNELTFNLHKGENIANLNPIINNRYIEILDSDQIQVPLFKYIKHKNYELYIGIPYNTSLEAITQDQANNSISSTKDSLHYFSQYKKGELFISKYVAKYNNESLVYICTVSNSSKQSDLLFNKVELSKRINTNDK